MLYPELTYTDTRIRIDTEHEKIEMGQVIIFLINNLKYEYFRADYLMYLRSIDKLRHQNFH